MHSTKKYLRHLSLCLAGGLLYAWGFPNPILPAQPLTPIIGLTLFLATLAPQGKEHSLKTQAQLLLAFCLGTYIGGYSWLAFTLTEFGQIPFPLNQLLGLCLTPILLPQYWCYLATRKLALRANKKFFTSPPRPWGPLNAACLVLLEYLIPQQFPAHLGHSWLPLAPYLGLANIFGVPLYSFVGYYLSHQLAQLAHTKKISLLCLTTLALFMAGNLLFPLSPPQADRSLQLRVVQANIGNPTKIDAEGGQLAALRIIHSRYLYLSTLPSPRPIDLIIWPETAIAEPLDLSALKAGHIPPPPFITQATRQMTAEIIVGGYGVAEGADDLYFEGLHNSLFHINDQGQYQNAYHKRLLIPFGETIPLGPLKQWLYPLFPQVSFFAQGTQQPSFTLRNGSRFIPAICYEILFPRLLNQYLNQLPQPPHFIINLTNDSWYGNTFEPLQHRFLAHWRAIELGLPIVRSTNTGISSILYPDGSQSPQLTLGQTANLDIHFKFEEGSPTLYQRYGILPSILVMILVSALALLTPPTQRH